MKCPLELRQKIYTRYIQRSQPGLDIVPAAKRSSCVCAPHDTMILSCRSKSNTALGMVSKEIRGEFFTFLYSRQMIFFSCACDMNHHLANNELLRNSLRGIKVHWVGADSDKAFKTVAKCNNLNRLHVVISRSTTFNLTPRQTELYLYFSIQRQPRLYEALGIDELLELRGLFDVRVMHILAKQGSRRSDEEKAGLQALLNSKLLQPRNVSATTVHPTASTKLTALLFPRATNPKRNPHAHFLGGGLL